MVERMSLPVIALLGSIISAAFIVSPSQQNESGAVVREPTAKIKRLGRSQAPHTTTRHSSNHV